MSLEYALSSNVTLRVTCGVAAGLVALRVLNAQYCGLSTLPAELVCCEQLETLVLHGNALDALPDELFALARLAAIHFNARVFARRIDAHMDALLARNQLQSTHLPAVLFDLPALRTLDLEGTPPTPLSPT